MKIYSLGSGSKGNSTIVTDGKTNIMIDAGLGVRTIAKRLTETGFSIKDIHGIFVTHEHDDHIKSLAEMSKYVNVYSEAETIEYFLRNNYKANSSNFFANEGGVNIGNMRIEPFSISHDAVRPVGYVITDGKEKVGYVTDTGIVTDEIKNSLCGADIAVIESNHDVEMLKRGPYPWYIKERILSDRGHLSNNAAALLASFLADNGTKKIMLAHISENNNLPELVYFAMNGVLTPEIKCVIAHQRETVVLE